MHGVLFQDYVNNNLTIFPDYHKCENEACNNVVSPRRKACSRECDKAIRKMKVGEKAPRYGTKHTKETINAIKQIKTNLYNNPENHPMFGKHHSEVSKQRMSQTRLERGLGVGELNGMYGKTHKPESIEKILKHRYKNKLEQLVCDTLDKHNIEYTFQYFLRDGDVCKSYDFHIRNTKVLLEIDGDYWHGKEGAKQKYKKYLEVQENDKLKTKLAEDSGYVVVRFWESDIKQDTNILINRLEPLLR